MLATSDVVAKPSLAVVGSVMKVEDLVHVLWIQNRYIFSGNCED